VSLPTEVDLRFHDGAWTEADYLGLPEDRARIELLDGGLLVNPAPSVTHQRLSSRLWLALEAARPVGMEILAAVNVRVAPGRILIPDLVAVVVYGGDVKVLDAADVALVVEIVSPDSVAADRALKPQLYAAARIPTYARIELRRGSPRAMPFRLGTGGYVATDPAPDHVLRLTEPFAAEVDLAALLAAERPQPR
jgi:Uma2 family endonuclease